jgi:hypothetical protein
MTASFFNLTAPAWLQHKINHSQACSEHMYLPALLVNEKVLMTGYPGTAKAELALRQVVAA